MKRLSFASWLGARETKIAHEKPGAMAKGTQKLPGLGTQVATQEDFPGMWKPGISRAEGQPADKGADTI